MDGLEHSRVHYLHLINLSSSGFSTSVRSSEQDSSFHPCVSARREGLVVFLCLDCAPPPAPHPPQPRPPPGKPGSLPSCPDLSSAHLQTLPWPRLSRTLPADVSLPPEHPVQLQCHSLEKAVPRPRPQRSSVFMGTPVTSGPLLKLLKESRQPSPGKKESLRSLTLTSDPDSLGTNSERGDLLEK